MKYLFTVLVTLFIVWLGFMLWFHFPGEWMVVSIIVVPIFAIYLIEFID